MDSMLDRRCLGIYLQVYTLWIWNRRMLRYAFSQHSTLCTYSKIGKQQSTIAVTTLEGFKSKIVQHFNQREKDASHDAPHSIRWRTAPNFDLKSSATTIRRARSRRCGKRSSQNSDALRPNRKKGHLTIRLDSERKSPRVPS